MIDLGKGYVIAVDEYNYTFGKLRETKQKDGTIKETVQAIGYYSNLVNAINGARDYFIKKCLNVDTLVSYKDTAKDIQRLNEEFEAKLKRINDGRVN